MAEWGWLSAAINQYKYKCTLVIDEINEQLEKLNTQLITAATYASINQWHIHVE